MTRNAVRIPFMLGCLVTLSFVHLLWSAKAAEQQGQTLDPKVLDAFVARNIGPSKMGGRITAIAGVDAQPNIVYFGSVSGGTYKTTNSGDTWTPIFDNESSVCVGDIAVCQSNPNIVWIGTGEANPRNSVAWGDGVYKSVDGGKSWKNMGLRDSHSIGRVVIHPKNPNVVYVAAMGHTWGPNKERGIFKTINGGETWEHVKFWDENTGVIELKMHPTEHDTLICVAWEVRRDAFSGGEPVKVFGPHAGLYKTTDGGKTWNKLTEGLPSGQTGRCGVDFYRKDPNIVYAIVNAKGKGGKGFDDPDDPNGGGGIELVSLQAGKDQKKDDQKKDDPKKGDPQKGGKGGKGGGGGPGGPDSGGTYRSEDGGKTWKNLNTTNPRPMYFSQIRVDPNDDKRIYMAGVQFYVSDTSGNTYEARFTSGLGNPLNSPHCDHHAIWVNPQNSEEVYLGSDGGISRSKDRAKTFQTFLSFPLGQYYGISVDMRKPYWVFGGCQDNGGFGTPRATTDPAGIRTNLILNISGGDGFHTQNDPTDWTTVYSESQNGGLTRVDLSKKGGKGKGAEGFKMDPAAKKDDPGQKKDDPKKGDPDQKKDDPKKGDPQKGGGFGGGGKGTIKPAGNNRWNWSTPMLLSPHDPWTFYCGSQFLYMSKERGNNPKAISADLTYGAGAKDFAYDDVGKLLPALLEGQQAKKDVQDQKVDPAKKDEPQKGGKGGGGGGGAHSLFTIGESPKKRGVLWTGSDDGRIMVTRDFGQTWTDVSVIPGLPKDRCVSRVEPSHFADGTCYVSITRYRNDDRKPYVYRTTDFGKTWENVTNNLPENGSVHVVIESSRNKNLLFCGTEFGVFASLDAGKSWHRMKGGMPTVSVHDLVIHPRDRDLVVGTHGRSIFIFNDISPLETLTSDVASKPAHLFEVRPATAFQWKKTGPDPKSNEFTGANPAYGAVIRFHLSKTPAASTVSILDADSGKQVASLPVKAKTGINEVIWNLRADGEKEATVRPGDYVVVLDSGNQKLYRMVRVEAE